MQPLRPSTLEAVLRHCRFTLRAGVAAAAAAVPLDLLRPDRPAFLHPRARTIFNQRQQPWCVSNRLQDGAACVLAAGGSPAPPTRSPAAGGLQARDSSEERALLQAGRQEEGGGLLVGEQRAGAGLGAGRGLRRARAACKTMIAPIRPALTPWDPAGPTLLPLGHPGGPRSSRGPRPAPNCKQPSRRRHRCPRSSPPRCLRPRCTGPQEAAGGAPHRGGAHLLHHDLLG